MKLPKLPKKLPKISLFGYQLSVTFRPIVFERMAREFLLEYLNYKNFFTILPFFLGSYYVMSYHYRMQFFSYFFRNNVPGGSLTCQTMTMDTFALKNQSKIKPTYWKQVDVYHDSIVIQCNNKTKSDRYILKSTNPETTEIEGPTIFDMNQIFESNETYFEFENTIPTSETIIRSRYVFPKLPPQQFVYRDRFQFFHLLSELVSHNYDYYLDEFPLKLEGIKISEDSFPDILPAEENLIGNQPDTANQNTQISLPSDFLVQTNSTQFDKLTGFYTLKTKNRPAMRTGRIVTQVLSWLNTQDFFQNGAKRYFHQQDRAATKFFLQWFFHNHSLVPFNGSNQIQFDTQNRLLIGNRQYSFSDPELLEYSAKEILSLTNDLLPIKQNNLIKPRKQSGYFYPDLDTSKVWSLGVRFYSQVRQYFLPAEVGIRVSLPPGYGFSAPTVYPLPPSSNPEMDIRAFPMALVDTRTGKSEMTYFGPGVVQNSDTGEIDITNRDQLKNWAKYYFGAGNALTDRRDGFFGRNIEKGDVNDPNSIVNQDSVNPLVVKEKDMRQKIRHRGTVFRAPIFDYFPMGQKSKSVWVPYFGAEEWAQYLAESPVRNKLKIPYIKLPDSQPIRIEWPREGLDYFHEVKMSDLNSKFKNVSFIFPRPYPKLVEPPAPRFVLHFPPTIEEMTPYGFVDKYRIDHNSKNVKSIFDGEKQTRLTKFLRVPYIENREPITFNSWLFITQIPVALFLIKCAKDVYELYGREVIDYLLELVSLVGLLDPEVGEILQEDQIEKSFRVLTNVKDRFTDFLGMEDIIDQFGDVVWFLRNKGREFEEGKIIPKGILLYGPPGTGKTLIARALAGESQVPVIVESGSSLTDTGMQFGGTNRVQVIFERARELAPCILFIDEIDSVGQARQNVQPPWTGDPYVLLYEDEYNQFPDSSEIDFIPKPIAEDDGKKEDPYIPRVNIFLQKLINQIQERKRKTVFLAQLLIELDGLTDRSGVVVIGATNRPDTLDPALLRPGRFDRKIQVRLPGKDQRIQLLKFYGQALGFQEPIPWDYFANRTDSLSPADIETLINESAMQAIFNNTIHTVETIEKGVDLVTNFSTDKINLKRKSFKDPFFVARFAYYQAGKAVIHSLLPHHPPAVVLYLWPRIQNARHAGIKKRFLYTSRRRGNYEARLIGFYAGKAAEMVLIGSNYQKYSKVWLSDLGLDEIQKASALAFSMVEKWYFYAKRLGSRIRHTSVKNERNLRELRYQLRIEKYRFLFNEAITEIDKKIVKRREEEENPNDQTRIDPGPWWSVYVGYTMDLIRKKYGLWYRFHICNPRKRWNLEYLPPDRYIHDNDRIAGVGRRKTTVKITEYYQIDRDYLFHSLVMASFNRAFSLLNQHRELLDIFADYLIRHEIIRQDEITARINQYLDKYPEIRTELELRKNSTPQWFYDEELINAQSEYIIDKEWGPDSRRKVSRVINFQELETYKENRKKTRRREYKPFQILETPVPVQPRVVPDLLTFIQFAELIENVELNPDEKKFLSNLIWLPVLIVLINLSQITLIQFLPPEEQMIQKRFILQNRYQQEVTKLAESPDSQVSPEKNQ